MRIQHDYHLWHYRWSSGRPNQQQRPPGAYPGSGQPGGYPVEHQHPGGYPQKPGREEGGTRGHRGGRGRGWATINVQEDRSSIQAPFQAKISFLLCLLALHYTVISSSFPLMVLHFLGLILIFFYNIIFFAHLIYIKKSFLFLIKVRSGSVFFSWAGSGGK